MDYKHIIILYLCTCGVICYPTKPLDDRPSELAWQAWLLVDSQNAQEGDRRITPKSVFIAPNIGDNGSSLPECAEGYRSDPMGRCIKFVKVDEAAHLDFLLQRLNAMYATKSSLEFDDENKPTSGPLQVNIPLGESMEDEKPEIAIIVAPTNGNFDEEVKFEKRTQNKTVTTTEQEETTTEEISTTEATTMTTQQQTEDLQALFFLLPKNHDNSKDNPITTTENEELTETEPDFTEKSKPEPIFEPNLKSEFSVRDTINFDRIIPERLVQTEKITTPEEHRLSSSEIEHLFEDYISQKPDLKDINLHRRRPPEETYFDQAPQLQRPFNHRNRDRSDFWRPEFRREETSQKPLVLRFNRHHPSYSEDRSEEQVRYFEERQHEFYGRKRKRGSLR